MNILQSGHFSKTIKRLHHQEKIILDDAIKFLMDNPEAGDLKIGDLISVRIYKFKFNLDRMLLAYKYDKETDAITLLAYGQHENFYLDLKKIIL